VFRNWTLFTEVLGSLGAWRSSAPRWASCSGIPVVHNPKRKTTGGALRRDGQANDAQRGCGPTEKTAKQHLQQVLQKLYFLLGGGQYDLNENIHYAKLWLYAQIPKKRSIPQITYFNRGIAKSPSEPDSYDCFLHQP
jgi:hypothetical protein